MKKALIINPFGIGDVIFSMSLARALKTLLPQVVIGFLGNERTLALLRMNADIDVPHAFDRDSLRAQRRKGLLAYVARARAYVHEIRKEGYDTAFDLSLGREFAFAAMLAGIPKRVGFDLRGRGLFLTHRLPLKGYSDIHVADRQLTLLSAVGLEAPCVSSKLPLRVPSEARRKMGEALKEQGVSGKYFVVAPGGGKSWGADASYKQWAPERFGQASTAWAQRTGQAVALLGDADEEGLLRFAKKYSPERSAVFTGRSLEEACALLEGASLFLGNDGGLLHLANALGIRSVGIYGPVDERVYGPYGADTPHAVLSEPVACRPCYQDFRFPPCEHSRRCLEELSVEKVLAAMGQIS